MGRPFAHPQKPKMDKLRLCKTCLLLSIYVMLVLTGFVCPHKITADEECQSSTPYCYECDSRNEPNCVDPFDFAAGFTQETSELSSNKTQHGDQQAQNRPQQQDNSMRIPNEPTISTNITSLRQPKRLPPAMICHGCCVKITSRTPEGNVYVKRTCTTKLQINFFMVGLVCMKESGDRGKMCFCETDFCNGQLSSLSPQSISITLGLIVLSIYYQLVAI